ncbi:glycoside hydrolase family 5 protein [Duganella callida]|uniref:Glycoside hydrolase n=1 Tax=Duganella callida TaxID=2561932 RepID=A0A4Y9SCI0_9BURK|nr:cellulase family glycosylhydrolase [Duganella callida]TFW19804.1 glycoside hydrolase [Duganella callida]
MLTKRLLATALLLIGSAHAQTRLPTALPMLHTEGTKWLTADGTQPALRGINLGNYLIQEFWMMGQETRAVGDQCSLEAVLDKRFGYEERQRLYTLFRDNWIRERDWDMLPRMNLNLVRLPFIYSVVEDEKHPRQLRADAWKYFDNAIAEAEKRGVYVILDLHGAVGSQGWEHHSGCAGRNKYWDTPEYQERTIWLWQQIAARYKDRGAVAGYSILNEPWGTTPENLAVVVETLYKAIREVDTNHVIILPGHNKTGIDAYGKPADHGMTNVAFEMHPYPGHFGWGKPGLEVHKNWLQCSGKGDNVCKWKTKLEGLDTAFFVGEFQPWAFMGAENGGQVMRVTYDTYVANGWANTAWAYKLVSNRGGQGKGTWGLVTNAPGAKIPKLDFNKASLDEIENLFRLFGSVPYEPQQTAIKWMNAPVAPTPFAK